MEIPKHITTDAIRRCVELSNLYTQMVCWGILPVVKNRDEDLVKFIQSNFYGSIANMKLNLKRKMERCLAKTNDEM